MIVQIYSIPNTCIKMTIHYNGWSIAKQVRGLYMDIQPTDSECKKHKSTNSVEKLEALAVSIRDGYILCDNRYRVVDEDSHVVDDLDWLMLKDAEDKLADMLNEGADVYIQERTKNN